jgi:hypothetical protein
VKAVPIKQTDELAEPEYSRSQSIFGFAIARAIRRTPRPTRKPAQRHDVLEKAKYEVRRKKSGDKPTIFEPIQQQRDHERTAAARVSGE